jgi:isopenicillin-N N-acyltransferase-like protein
MTQNDSQTGLSRRRMLQVGLVAAAPSPAGRKGRHLVYDFEGTAAEVGQRHGEALRKEIIAEAQPSAEALARRKGLPVEDALKRVAAAYEPIFREHVPSAIEEIRGMAEGAKVSYPFAFWAATRDGMRGDCTAVAASGRRCAGGGVLIGQNKDTSAPLERFRIMRMRYRGGPVRIMLNYPGWIGNLCLSSDGLCFTGNSLYAPAPGRGSMPLSLLKRILMERGSVRGALDETRDMVFANGCFLIAGADGQAVCVEIAGGRREVRDVSGAAFGHANSILLEPLKRMEQNQSASSPARQKRVDQMLRERSGALTAADFQAIFSDHGGFPLSICQHPEPPKNSGTNASFVADLAARCMHIAIGNPCVGGYVRYALDAPSQGA